jgi:hypothetical protein
MGTDQAPVVIRPHPHRISGDDAFMFEPCDPFVDGGARYAERGRERRDLAPRILAQQRKKLDVDFVQRFAIEFL